jgi:hypothetical protein
VIDSQQMRDRQRPQLSNWLLAPGTTPASPGSRGGSQTHARRAECPSFVEAPAKLMATLLMELTGILTI